MPGQTNESMKSSPDGMATLRAASLRFACHSHALEHKQRLPSVAVSEEGLGLRGLREICGGEAVPAQGIPIQLIWTILSISLKLSPVHERKSLWLSWMQKALCLPNLGCSPSPALPPAGAWSVCHPRKKKNSKPSEGRPSRSLSVFHWPLMEAH